jgi:hypothetical protein
MSEYLLELDISPTPFETNTLSNTNSNESSFPKE